MLRRGQIAHNKSGFLSQLSRVIIRISGFSKACLTIHYSQFYCSGLSELLHFSCIELSNKYFAGRYFFPVRKVGVTLWSLISWIMNFKGINQGCEKLGSFTGNVSTFFVILLFINSPGLIHYLSWEVYFEKID